MSRPVTSIHPPSFQAALPFTAIKRLPHFIDLLRTLSAHRVKVRYKQSRLGPLWAMLQPLAMMLVFALMFSFLGGRQSEGVPYALFAYSALLPWTAFSSGLSTASSALTSHAALLTKVSFPREILPLSYVVAALVDLATASLALVALMLWFHVGLQATAIWALVAIVLLTAFLTAASLLLSALQVRYRDVSLAMPVILQVWMFASPVLYPLSAVKHALSPVKYALYVLNPMAAVVDTFRRGVVLHETPDLHALAAGILVTALLLPITYTYFKYAELTMADVV